MVAVNARCLDDVDVDSLKVKKVDGRKLLKQWERMASEMDKDQVGSCCRAAARSAPMSGARSRRCSRDE